MNFIATVEIDEANFFWLEDLRRRYFSAQRHLLTAHLTLFHRLSVEQIERLRAAILPQQPLAINFAGIRFLGGGRRDRCNGAPALRVARGAQVQDRRVVDDTGCAAMATARDGAEQSYE